jgi:hypothetical protein
MSGATATKPKEQPRYHRADAAHNEADAKYDSNAIQALWVFVTKNQ